MLLLVRFQIKAILMFIESMQTAFLLIGPIKVSTASHLAFKNIQVQFFCKKSHFYHIILFHHSLGNPIK